MNPNSAPNFEELPKVLAALTFYRGKGNYSYLDKVANATTLDKALYYIREALRDFASLSESNDDMKTYMSKAHYLKNGVSWRYVDKELNEMDKLSNVAELRKALSLIGARALALGMNSATSGQQGEEVKS